VRLWLALGRLDLGGFFLAEDEVHGHADQHAEEDRANGAGDADVQAEHPGGQDDGEHVDRGPEYRKADAGPRPAPRL